MGVLSAIPFVLATVAMYLNARASDASPHQRARHVVLPMFLAGVTLLVQHVVTFGLLGNMILLIIAGIGLYAAFGPFWAWALQYIPRNQAGPAMGLINVAGNFGGIVGPLIVGAAAAGGAVANGFYVLGFFLLGAGLLAVATAVVAGRNNDAEVH